MMLLTTHGLTRRYSGLVAVDRHYRTVGQAPDLQRRDAGLLPSDFLLHLDAPVRRATGATSDAENTADAARHVIATAKEQFK